ncbi:MAG TPA: glycosyl hydrolase [Geminicoccaceae bacterium]|nr:glycosyl hydrolase [Geminicoccus sp.]HMU49436.1 glycosyl hydrolase [Geminicoccaceae bacterium]
MPVTHQSKPAQPSNPSTRKVGALSGLTWNSGMSCHDGRFDEFRGRASDVYVAFVGRTYRKDIIATIKGPDIDRYKTRPGRLSLSWPMLPTEIPHRFAECARGDYDQYVRDAANAVKSQGFLDPIIRIGFEANGRFTWSMSKYSDRINEYKGCFQRQATLFRSILPQSQIEWTNRRDSALPYSIETIYPGDAYVDIIGMMIYDRWPAHPNQKAWDAAYKQRDKFGGPRGLGTYLEYARKLKKKLAISEWAVSSGNGGADSVDNPFYIEKMFNFFKDNAADIAYEAYFNCREAKIGYKLAPNTVNPKAAAKYRELWSKGVSSSK